jgi:hypothetical protein
MRLTTKQLSQLVFLTTGLVILIGGSVIIYGLNRATIRDELMDLYLLPKPEKLTELYFNNHANLPSHVPNNRVICFSFVIHNLETTDYRYVYSVSINTNSTRHIVDSGTVLVHNDQYFIKDVQIHLPSSTGSQQIAVELINKKQLIDFWINKEK